jgi:hypothetical protein
MWGALSDEKTDLSFTTGCKHQMGALFQDRLSDRPSVVTLDSDSDSESEKFRDCARVEAWSNTYTVALRVVGFDEKGTQCLGL